MHTLKGGWVGQTFALAKCNESDSGGGGSRKSRIRRSKEERKAMVESFINKYQTKNNGNFPSLNLTHKEVGGSFYTVREIVREIIQENRVLGPAKLTPLETTSDDKFSQEYPLGSIATEPQIPLSPAANETQPELIYFLNDDNSDECVRLSEEKHCSEKELLIVDGSQVILKSYVPVATAEAEVVLDESVASTSKVIGLTNVEMDTFPLKSITNDANGAPEILCENLDSVETLDEKQTADLNSGSRLLCGKSEFYGSSSLDKSAFEDNKAGKYHTRSSVAIAENAKTGTSKAVELADPLVESSDSSVTKEGMIHGAENGKSLTDKAFSHDASNSKGSEDVKEDTVVQAIIAPNDAPVDSFNDSILKTDSVNSFLETKIDIKPEAPPNKSIPRESSPNPPLDRINLESWEASSSASRRETNPLLAIFKAFVASLVKFWTE